VPTEDGIIITSGRVSSEILLKAARRNIPILVSKSAPTNLGAKLAADLGMTLIGFVRGRRMNIYSCAWRVLTDAE
jgi:FdhD protein